MLVCDVRKTGSTLWLGIWFTVFQKLESLYFQASAIIIILKTFFFQNYSCSEQFQPTQIRFYIPALPLTTRAQVTRNIGQWWKHSPKNRYNVNICCKFLVSAWMCYINIFAVNISCVGYSSFVRVFVLDHGHLPVFLCKWGHILGARLTAADFWSFGVYHEIQSHLRLSLWFDNCNITRVPGCLFSAKKRFCLLGNVC